MKAERDEPPELHAFHRAEKMRLKIRGRSRDVSGRVLEASPHLMNRIARADRRLARARAAVDRVDQP